MSDLTAKEQANVRAALRFLRAKCGGWLQVAHAIRMAPPTLHHALRSRPVSASVALRVARLAQVSVDGLLAGEFPPAGACPHCGRLKEDS